LLNDLAQFHKNISIQEIVDSYIVADPLRLYHCSPITDGAAALVLSTSRGDSVVELVASEIAHDTLSPTRRESLTEFGATQRATSKAMKSMNMTIQDVDLFELHDAFSILEILSVEDIGLCRKGEGGAFIAQGNTLVGGAAPVNSTGGLKAVGHPVGATGVRQICDLVKKFREADRYEIGLAQNVGGFGSTVSINMVKKL
jgi:acetyl-CoA C-acetyltransferase